MSDKANEWLHALSDLSGRLSDSPAGFRSTGGSCGVLWVRARYCEDCHERWLSTQERSRWHFVPFRDKASQGNLKPSWGHLKRRYEELEREGQPSQDDPDPTDPAPALPEGAAVVEDASIFDADPMLPHDGGLGAQNLLDAHVDEHEVVLPHAATLEDLEEPKVELPEMEVERPTLQEYQAKWDTALEHHSRRNEAPFFEENLCPVPVPQLWCPSRLMWARLV